MFRCTNQNTLRFEHEILVSDPIRSLKSRWVCTACTFLVGFMFWQCAEAQTFDQSSNTELQDICNNQINTVLDPLGDICVLLPSNQAGGVTTASSGVGSLSQPNSFLISEQQLRDALGRKTRRLRSARGDLSDDLRIIDDKTDKERTDRPPSGSADSVAANWGRFSTFLTAGATTLRHRQNDYEQGYTATIPSVTLGGAYLISDSLETGLAFNYFNSNAVNITGGGFNVDSYTPSLFINFLPFENAFANLTLGYTRQNQTNNRIAVAGINKFTDNIISRSTTGKFNANQYQLNFLSGFDGYIENITFGPRVGVNVRQWEMNSYQESTNTGLELRYNNQYQTSIQSILGLFISSAYSTAVGVFVPQLTASWVHEYANNSRTVRAQFVQAPLSNGFSFQTESPARNWAAIDIGVSFVLPRDVQAFANFSTVQGNRNFESYGGNIGIRVGW